MRSSVFFSGHNNGLKISIRKTIYFLCFLLSLTFGQTGQCIAQKNGKTITELKQAKKVLKLMGTRFEITALHSNEQIAWDGLNAGIKEIERIEALISSWQPTSETSLINQNAGLKPVQVSQELFNLIDRSLKISHLTAGAFDISFEGIEPIWTYKNPMTQIPDSTEVLKSIDLIGYRHIILDKAQRTVFLEKKGMKVSFGSIGKGYAANRAKQVMIEKMAIKNGVVNASGDLLAWGKDLNNNDWRIAIQDPLRKDQILGLLKASDLAIVTSGDYEKFIQIGDTKFSHIINPKTGWPANELVSVTIICKDAELADALATSISVMGSKKGLALINQMPGFECLLIDKAGKLYESNGIHLIRE